MLSAIEKWDIELRDIWLTNPSFMSDDGEKLVAIKNMKPTKIKEYVDIHGQTMSYAEVMRLTMDWAVNKKSESLRITGATGMDLSVVLARAMTMMEEGDKQEETITDIQDPESMAEAILGIIKGKGKGK